MSDKITLDKHGLATIMLGSVTAAMKDLSKVEKQAMHDEYIDSYKKLAQDIINQHGEPEAPKIVLP